MSHSLKLIARSVLFILLAWHAAKTAGQTTMPADLGLSSQAPARIVQGANIPVYGYIYNEAPTGSDDLNYSIYYELPGGGTSTAAMGTKSADGGATFDTYRYDFDSSLAQFGDNVFTIHAAGQQGTLHSPQTQQVTVEVVNHVVPAMWIQGVEVHIDEAHHAAQEPDVDPLAFGATGGGESFAAGCPHIIGDPTVPTAALDLDSISSEGDAQITTDLAPVSNVSASDDPSSGIAWHVFVDGSTLGQFSKIFTVRFSDEDIPGASPTGSVVAYLEILANVDGNGVSGSIEVVPEAFVAVAILPVIFIAGRPVRPLTRSGRS
jgi:hypothetical protein